MAKVQSLSAISSGDAVLAAPMTNNFSQVVIAANSQALNSDNYAGSSIQSQNVQSNAVLSQHIVNSILGGAKLASACVSNPNMDFRYSTAGVRFMQIGGASDSFPADGLRLAMASQTMALTAAGTLTMNWSDAIHGDPSFTDTPNIVGNPTVVVHSTSGSSPVAIVLSSVNSASCEIGFLMQAASAQTMTVQICAIGAV